MVFSQYNSNAAGGNIQGAEMDLRGTKAPRTSTPIDGKWFRKR